MLDEDDVQICAVGGVLMQCFRFQTTEDVRGLPVNWIKESVESAFAIAFLCC